MPESQRCLQQECVSQEGFEGVQRDARMFKALFEQALDAVLIADDERRYVVANPAACALIGLEQEAVIGRRIEEFFEVLEHQRIPEAWRAFQREGTQTGICRARRPDGSFRYAWFQAKANFTPGLHLSILRDVTEQRASEDARAAAHQELREANKELERSNEELSYFAYTVAHHLGPSLRTIASFSQLLRSGGGVEIAGLEYLSRMDDALAGMDTFLEDLLTFAQVGRSGQTWRMIDSEAVMHFAIANLRGLIEESRALISHDRLPLLYADERQIAQLFQNLIENALKYRGGRAPRVHIGAQAIGDEWTISVTDNGMGIPLDRQTVIFEIFKRLHGREIRGTGLGLALCKRIVENYGGRIWVESQPGQGSTFRFTLPAAPALASERESAEVTEAT